MGTEVTLEQLMAQLNTISSEVVILKQQNTEKD